MLIYLIFTIFLIMVICIPYSTEIWSSWGEEKIWRFFSMMGYCFQILLQYFWASLVELISFFFFHSLLIDWLKSLPQLINTVAKYTLGFFFFKWEHESIKNISLDIFFNYSLRVIVQLNGNEPITVFYECGLFFFCIVDFNCLISEIKLMGHEFFYYFCCMFC